MLNSSRLSGEQYKLLKEFPDASLTEARAPLAKKFSGLNLPNTIEDTRGCSLVSAIQSFKEDQFEEVLLALSSIKQPEIRGMAIVGLCRLALVRPKIEMKKDLPSRDAK